MELAKYVACICEGSAEHAIMDILLDNDLLIFTREEMLEEEVIRCREGKRFEERYLRKGYGTTDLFHKERAELERAHYRCSEDFSDSAV